MTAELTPVLARIDELERALLRANPPMVMSSKECADFLGYSAEHMSNLKGEGRGPKCSKLGRRVHYLRDDVLDWLRQHQ